MNKLEKNILHRIDFDKDKLLNKNIDFNSSLIFTYEKHIATKIAEKLDETILNLIYQEYKDTEYDSVLILDKSEFKDFLLKYLPIYLEERNHE